MKIKLSFILSFILLICSCSGSDEEKLIERLDQIADQEIKANKDLAKGASLEQYREIELKMNESYIESLKALVENNYTQQLETFEENELGVIAGYQYMFKYISSSDQEWEDTQTQLSDRYFNSLILKQKANELSDSHIEDIQNLRSQFYSSKKGVSAPQIAVLDIPKSEIFIGSLSSHSKNNLAIEIGTTILDILLGILITKIIVDIIGLAMTGCVAWFVPILTFVIMILISIPLTSYNDGQLLDSLREQETSITIDYGDIHSLLDQNTNRFYGKIK